jgi:ABC-type nitrate/sulfonate/bicarbonate transport system substrate-binding protein
VRKPLFMAMCSSVLMLILGACGGSSAPAAPAGSAASGSQPAKLINLKVSQTADGTSSWPLHVAIAQGFFRDAGFNVELVNIASSATQTQALLNGDVNFNIYTIDSIAKAVAAGADLKFIGAAQDVPNLAIYAGPGITTWADFKGKTLAAGSPNGFFDIMLHAAMRANGLQRTDFQVLSIPNDAARVPAIQVGNVQGALVSTGSASDLLARSAGLKLMGNITDYVKDVQYNGYTVSTKWATGNDSTVVGFLRAVKKAAAWTYDPANKAALRKIVADPDGADAPYWDSLYDLMVNQKMLSANVQPNMKGVQNMMDLAVQQGAMDKAPPIDSWVDLSYLEKASK